MSPDPINAEAIEMRAEIKRLRARDSAQGKEMSELLDRIEVVEQQRDEAQGERTSIRNLKRKGARYRAKAMQNQIVLRAERDAARADCGALLDMTAKMEMELGRALDRLKKYGGHTEGCRSRLWHKDDPRRCDCGWAPDES